MRHSNAIEKKGVSDLEASVATAKDLDSLPESVKAAVTTLDHLKADVKQHQADKTAAKAATAEATAVREKEVACFAMIPRSRPSQKQLRPWRATNSPKG